MTPTSDAADGGSSNRYFLPTTQQLTTPLVLPVASNLWVDVTNVTGSGDIGPRNVTVHLVGRVVNL